MFRGGSYIDDPKFSDLQGKPGYNYLDVTDINKEDKFGNNIYSPSHQKYKRINDRSYISQGDISDWPPQRPHHSNLGIAGESIINSPLSSRAPSNLM